MIAPKMASSGWFQGTAMSIPFIMCKATSWFRRGGTCAEAWQAERKKRRVVCSSMGSRCAPVVGQCKLQGPSYSENWDFGVLAFGPCAPVLGAVSDIHYFHSREEKNKEKERE